MSSSEPSDTDDTAHQESDNESIFESPHASSSVSSILVPSTGWTSIRGSSTFSEAEWAALHAPPENQSDPVKLATLPLYYAVNDLDYECLPLDDANFNKPNRILLPTSSNGNPEYLHPQGVASEAEECSVLAVTGTTGLVKGTISKNSYYIKMSGSSKCQEMWPVRLERNTSELSPSCQSIDKPLRGTHCLSQL